MRFILRSPGFAIVAILTLGLGIGATTAMFSTADAVLWKPVALPNPGRLLMVLEAIGPNDWTAVAPANYLDWKAQSKSFEHISAYQWSAADLVAASGEGQRAIAFLVSADFFDTAGVKPMLGRAFLPEEEEPGRDDAVILSHGLWQRKFGGDPGLVGKTIRLDTREHVVVGIMPRDFDFPLSAELWRPLALTSAQRASRTSRSLLCVARLKPRVPVEQARAEMQGIGGRLAREYPVTNAKTGADVLTLRRLLVEDEEEQYILMVLGAVGFVLLIACANVANLQFARATARSREFAVRTALGASRWRLMSHVLGETLTLSLCGAALGVVLAFWGVYMVRSNMPPEAAIHINNWYEMKVDGRTLAFMLAIAVASGILSGLAPAIQVGGTSVNAALKEGGRGGSPARHRLRDALVVVEVALAVVLLAGAGLMVKGFTSVLNVNRNLEPESLLTMRISIAGARYKDRPAVTDFYERLLDRWQALPGVQSAAVVTALPHSQHSSGRGCTLEGRPAPSPEAQPVCHYQAASPGYFATLRIPLREGRFFGRQDGANAPGVAVVSAEAARRFWPGESPVGKRIKMAPYAGQAPWLTVVGVAGDVQHLGWDRRARNTVYVPFAQAPNRYMDVALRAAGDPMRLAAGAEAAVRMLDREQPVYQIKTMRRLIDEETIAMRYVAVLMGIFGVLALVLPSVGVYGVMSYSVNQQTHDIGVRMALGAHRRNVLAMVLRRGLLMALGGVALGLPVAFLLARTLASLIFGIGAGDPATFTLIPAILIAVAVVACYIPARRAAAVDPMAALRYE